MHVHVHTLHMYINIRVILFLSSSFSLFLSFSLSLSLFLSFSLSLLSESLGPDINDVFSDVVDDFCDLNIIKTRFEQWKFTQSNSYSEAYVSLCLTKIFTPYVRHELLYWNPLEVRGREGEGGRGREGEGEREGGRKRVRGREEEGEREEGKEGGEGGEGEGGREKR